MKVYVVIGGWDWESREIVKIYTTMERADKKAIATRKLNSYDYVEIEEHKVLGKIQ